MKFKVPFITGQEKSKFKQKKMGLLNQNKNKRFSIRYKIAYIAIEIYFIAKMIYFGRHKDFWWDYLSLVFTYLWIYKRNFHKSKAIVHYLRFFGDLFKQSLLTLQFLFLLKTTQMQPRKTACMYAILLIEFLLFSQSQFTDSILSM